jgi:hypothetical protein
MELKQIRTIHRDAPLALGLRAETTRLWCLSGGGIISDLALSDTAYNKRNVLTCQDMCGACAPHGEVKNLCRVEPFLYPFNYLSNGRI